MTLMTLSEVARQNFLFSVSKKLKKIRSELDQLNIITFEDASHKEKSNLQRHYEEDEFSTFL